MTGPEPTLSRASPEPLYRQLARHLEAAIERLAPGDRLDSEGQLSDRFGVSRITVRQAIEELARKQFVVRKQGKGTFVTKPAVQHDLRRLHGLLASLFAQSDAASTELLRYQLATPPPNRHPVPAPTNVSARPSASTNRSRRRREAPMA